MYDCRQYKAVMKENIFESSEKITPTDDVNNEDTVWIKENASHIYKLGNEDNYVLRDHNTSFGYTHASNDKCYNKKCNQSNSINSGPRKEGNHATKLTSTRTKFSRGYY